MSSKPKRPPLTDTERHQRFVETARAVEAYEDPKDFDAAFRAVVGSPTRPHGKKPEQSSD